MNVPVVDFFRDLLNTDFMPHGMCYLWKPEILWLHAASDSVIALSYYSIPFTLRRLVRKRPDLPFRWVFLAFAAFILACGTTHLLSVLTIWHGIYRLDGLMKALTALLSAGTAAGFVWILPSLLQIPSPALLASANEDLRKEVESRRSAELKLTIARRELETRVRERTQELALANDALRESIQSAQQSRAEIEHIFSTLPTALGFVGRDLTFVRINEQLRVLDEFVRSERLAATERWKVAAGKQELVEAVFQTGEARRAIPFTGSVHGNRREWMMDLHPLQDHHGVTTGVHMVVLDVTEQKRLEDQLHQSQKLEAVGRLAGGVAHDFNNLLTVIIGYNSMMLEEVRPEDPLRLPVEQVGKAANQAAELTRQLLAFGRREVIQPRVVNINELVDETRHTMRRLIEESISIHIHLEPDLSMVRVDPGQFRQVLFNLLLNARDAIQGSGMITVETMNTELSADYPVDYPKDRIDLRPGRYVMLAVSDTGVGMDPETRQQIFEPFFTTKQQGKGTGLGLATVYGIVKQNQGDIWVYSEPGRGSTFKVYLPVELNAGEALLPELPAAEERKGTETVLVVEDEDNVRELVCTLLQAQGYRPLSAPGPREALDLLTGLNFNIDLLVTDVVMPLMNGYELQKAVRRRVPSLPVIYMSGYTERAIAEKGMSEPGSYFLQKPFTPDRLLEAVRRALDVGTRSSGA